jgi:hypothetical protein
VALSINNGWVRKCLEIIRKNFCGKAIAQSIFSDYLNAEQKEMLSPENKWFAGEALKHDPSPEECALHYIKNGGAKAYADKASPKKP